MNMPLLSLLIITCFSQIGNSFEIIWTVPTEACNKYYNLEYLKEYGVSLNSNASSNGELIQLFYDPRDTGALPRYFLNGSEIIGEKNGGIPVKGNLQLHSDAVQQVVLQRMPDANYNGLAVYDFEVYVPFYAGNFDAMSIYNTETRRYFQQLHPGMTEEEITLLAAREFNRTAREFFETSLNMSRALRPAAKWGFYDYALCYDPINKPCVDSAGPNNDNLLWMYELQDAFYPCVYLYTHHNVSTAVKHIQSRVSESQRINHKLGSAKKIYPYYALRLQDNDSTPYLDEEMLRETLQALKALQVDGVVIWGGWIDVMNLTQCTILQNYVNETFIPVLSEL